MNRAERPFTRRRRAPSLPRGCAPPSRRCIGTPSLHRAAAPPPTDEAVGRERRDNSTVGNSPVQAFADYTCNIDGERGAGVGPNESHVHALAAGSHLVEMVGLPANCEVQGENPRIVTVVEGENVQVEFEINCW